MARSGHGGATCGAAWRAAAFLVLCAGGLSACSGRTGFVFDRYASFETNWDEAVAPISCKAFTYASPFFSINGTVVANGVAYTDGPITDPTATVAIAHKINKHLGPEC